jgi:hypothetical protein
MFFINIATISITEIHFDAKLSIMTRLKFKFNALPQADFFLKLKENHSNDFSEDLKIRLWQGIEFEFEPCHYA